MKSFRKYSWLFDAFAISALFAVVASRIDTNEEFPGKGVVLSPGHELFLQCNNTNDPQAKVIQWYKDSIAVNKSDSRIKIKDQENALMIESASDVDCGNYTCSFSRYNATIAVRSNVRLLQFDDSKNVVQNQNIVLVCNVTQGMPLPTLQWLKDGEPLNSSNPRIEVKVDTRGIDGSIVTINDANFDDRAEYTCIATNEISSANQTILVRVKDKYAALWPFLGICVEVAILCTIIFVYEKRRQKPDFDDSETEHNTENKNVPDQEDKNREVRQRK